MSPQHQCNRCGNEIYDPCCGSGGLLIKNFLRGKEKFGDNPSLEPVRFYGQEILHATYAMAKMNAFIHDMEAEIALGDTMNRPAFLTPVEDNTLPLEDAVCTVARKTKASAAFENLP